jgi:hypothetical protein
MTEGVDPRQAHSGMAKTSHSGMKIKRHFNFPFVNSTFLFATAIFPLFRYVPLPCHFDPAYAREKFCCSPFSIFLRLANDIPKYVLTVPEQSGKLTGTDLAE